MTDTRKAVHLVRFAPLAILLGLTPHRRGRPGRFDAPAGR